MLSIYFSCLHRALASISLSTTTTLLRKKENVGNDVWKGQFEVYLNDNSWRDVLQRLKIHFMVEETEAQNG